MARLQDFNDYLLQNSIPISGLSDAGPPYPAGVTINFLPTATAEQIAWANDAKAAFDWRERRMLTMNQIFTGLSSLTTQQQNTILRYMVGQFIREHKAEALAALTTAGIVLPIDEVDPNA